MNNQEKRHTSQRASMQHLRYLKSFMDEIDREVMSLTDRAFKSLCIGDEAIYNDSEFSPSPVSCHKPRVEEVSKKTQESSFSAVKKLDSYPLNGVHDALVISHKNSSKDISLFTVFPAKKNSKGTKMTNGDSWDKSALLSIQRELSEFSTDYHSLKVEQLSPVKNNLKSDEKGSANKSSNDASGKSSKCKNNKNNKLRKLNSKNFFLHSEFSPFLSWRDLNKFSIGQEHISEIMLSNRQSEWYDSPLYKELTAAHGHYKLHVPLSEEKDVEKCPKQTETQDKLQPGPVRSTPPIVPPKPKKETECIQHNILTKAPLLATEQRCISEKGDPCVPWRKNKSRANSAVNVGHSLITCERSNTGEGGAQPTEKEVTTIEDQTSSSSTPFSISQLLTPVIPSRHGTGTSEILQAVLSPTAFEVPLLPEREVHPSPEIKREGYKSMASSLLFNLKDNRKRVKAMYSPPKFKGLDVAGQSKESPLPEVSKDVLKIPEISADKTISPARHKAKISPMSPLLETADTQTCSPQGCANGGIPDDYLALSLLQSGGAANRPLKSNRSPSSNKAAYPSLQLYRKASPEEINIRENSQTVVDTSSQILTDNASNPEHIKDQDKQSNTIFKGVIKELQSESKTLVSMLNSKTPTVSLNTVKVPENKSGKSPNARSTKPDEQNVCEGTHQHKLKTRETVSMQKSPVKEKDSNRKEDGAKHFFSARQNNYIKSQRFVGTDDDDDNNHGDDGSDADKVMLTIKEKHVNDEWSKSSKNIKPKEIRPEEHNTGFHQDKGLVGAPLLKDSVIVGETFTTKKQNSIISMSDLETQKEQKEKNETFSMKGNTFAKRALFASMEHEPNKTTVPLKKENIVIDKYGLAKMALEEVIAEREQRKLKSKVVSNAGALLIDRGGCEDAHELPTNGNYQQTRMFMSERGTNTKDGKGQNSVSSFETSRQTIQTVSEDMVTKHGESHAAEVKLARPCKQEASVEQCRNAIEHIKYTERDRLCIGDQESKTDNASNGENVLGPRKKDLMAKNTGHAKVGTKKGHSLESKDIHSVSQCEEKIGIEIKGSSYKPEVPPRRGRSNSVEMAVRNKEFNRAGDTSVKTEETESREVSKVRRSQSKNRGPVRGNVSALKEKYDKESVVHHKDVQKCQPVAGACLDKTIKGPNEESAKDKIKHKSVIPKLTVSPPESETCSVIHKEMDSENKIGGKEESGSQREHGDTEDFLRTISDLTYNRQEMQEQGTENMEEGSVSLESGDNQQKYRGNCKSYVKDILNELLGLSSSERVKTLGEREEKLIDDTLSFESNKGDQSRKDNITVQDIFGQSQSLSSISGKQIHRCSLSSKELSLLHASECGSQSHLEYLSSKAGVSNLKEKEGGKVEGDFPKSKMDSCTFSNHENGSNVSEREDCPLGNVDKRGWVHCLIESARNLTQTSHNDTSSKDLHQMNQPLSQRESLNGSEKGEDLDLFKDCVHSSVAMPSIPAKSPQPNQPAMHLLSPLITQLTTVKEGKLSAGSVSLSEEEERRSAVSTLSEGVDSYETSGGDAMEENIFSTALTDAEGSKAPSERSGSVCSGNDSHGQNKPPAVPPKTEKALRRAMKLTTRRTQRAEKSERKGRSSDKSVSHKAERRHHSTDKIQSDRSEPRLLSNDRHSSKHGEHHPHDTLEPKTQGSEKHSRRHSHKSQNMEENDPCKKLQHAKDQDRQTNKAEKQQHQKSNHTDHLEKSNINNDTDRLGRSNEKHATRKLERRTQSLDRFLGDKHENKSNSIEKTGPEVNSELSIEELHYSTAKALPLRQNSIEHTIAPAANIVTQSFPITQRKLLQDPDSGQYFLVDMPVPVKTKTFFDPETKSYVQLPVQSTEAAVRQAPPLEVMNTPPLVLYHGFVPVPVSSLPSQKSIVRTAGSMITPDDLEDFETCKKQMQEDFYPKQEVHPYIEPVHISQEHTPEEEIDSVR